MTETITDFGHALANILRVMRGGGHPSRLLNDIERLAEITTATKSDYNARSRIKHELVTDLQSWWPDADDHPDVRHFEYGICEAALRVVASTLEHNGTQRTRAMSDLHRHFREHDQRMQQDADSIRKREIDVLVAEAQLRHKDRIHAHALNDVALAASNDNAESYVYFITDGEAIKIGKANNPKSRLSALQTSHHKPLVILATMPGGEELERELHRIFDAYRLRGEWFRDCSPLREFIESHSSKNSNNAVGNAA